MIIDINMPSAILLNRVDNSDRIEGFDDNNCHVGTGYVKANRALFDIADERQHQLSKGYDAENDDAEKDGNHARAAAFYATAAYHQRTWALCEDPEHKIDDIDWQAEAERDSVGYPWKSDIFRIKATARDNLIKAAALIIAEIERIDREGK